MGKMLASAVLATLVLTSVLAMSGLAVAEERPLDVRERVATGETDRFGGGDWVVVRAGETLFGVMYGTEETPNSIVIFAEYKRYLGGAEIYDREDNFLSRKGISVRTVFHQRLDFMVEFERMTDNKTFDFRHLDDRGEHPNLPLKALSLRDAWTLSDIVEERTNGSLFITFDLSLYDKAYDWVWDGEEHHRREATAEDGVVEEITFSFQLTIMKEQVSIDNVPWYKVVVSDGREREVISSEVLEERTYEGVATSVGVKYDHYFQGWDFASPESLLALETHAVMGTFTPKAVAQWIRTEYGHEEAQERDSELERGNHTGGDYRYEVGEGSSYDPVSITKDSIYFDDDWYRVGRLRWASDVEIDGKEARMWFQIHRAETIDFHEGARLFKGLALRGAYVYPRAEETIFHDPEFTSTALELSVPSVYNVAPSFAIMAQVAVIVLAVLAAVLVALTRKMRK